MLQQDQVKNIKARIAGETAGVSNKPLSSNPYQSGTDEYKDWVTGYEGTVASKNKSLSKDGGENKSKLFS